MKLSKGISLLMLATQKEQDVFVKLIALAGSYSIANHLKAPDHINMHIKYDFCTL